MRFLILMMIVTAFAGCQAQGSLDGVDDRGGGAPLPADSDISGWTPTEVGGSGLPSEILTEGLLCTIAGALGSCTVLNPELVADGLATTSGELDLFLTVLDPLTTTLGLDGSVTLVVPTRNVPAGQVAAFQVAIPASLVQAGVFDSIDVFTLLNGACQESTTPNLTGLESQLAGFVSDCELIERDNYSNLLLASLIETPINGDYTVPFLVGFVNTLPYDAVAIRVGGTVLHADPLDITLTLIDVVTNARP